MKKLSIIVFASVIGLTACQTEPKTDARVEVNVSVTEEVVTGDSAGVFADIQIEGMSCAVGCASKIQKTLSALQGVKSCEVAFEEKTAHLELTGDEIGEKELISAIEGLNDGQYKVLKLEIKKMVVKGGDSAVDEEHTESAHKEGEDKQVSTAFHPARLILAGVMVVLRRATGE